MPTPPPSGGTSTPRPDDDCLELIGIAYTTGFDDGYEYALDLCRKHHKVWFKKGKKPRRSKRSGKK